MTERLLGFVLLVCASLSAIVLWVVQANISSTQATVKTDAPAALNYLVQSDHNLDQVIDAVRELQLHKEDSTKTRAELETLLRNRFDVLWSSFSIFKAQFPVLIETELLVEEFNNDAQFFLNNTEPLFESGKPLSERELEEMISNTRTMSLEIRNLAHGYFVGAAKQQDAAENQITTLSGYMRVFIGLVMLTGGLGVGLLIRSNIRTNALFNEAQQARSELAATVDELRSGRREQKAKDSFIVAASHDLRQPLHALGLFLNTLKHDVHPSGQKALTEATRCLDGLNRLFNSLLDLSRLDAGVVSVAVESFDVHDLLSNVHTQLRPAAQVNGISLILKSKEAYAKTDSLLLSRIVRNLVENAIAHSGATRVSIVLKPVRDGHEISITDNGKGIAEDEHSAIFSEYYQLGNPERDRSKGLGLGLSIVKRLSQLLDLSVELDSTLGAGTQFKLVVPAGEPTSTPVISEVEDAEALLEGLTDSVIVVIDDDSSIREAMKIMLTNLRLISVCAETTDEALEQLAQRNLEPSLVIADYRLRDHLTGDKVIRQLREAIETDIPGLIITGDTSPARVSELTETGFEILHKPVDADTLHRRIHEMLNQRAYA